jgi:GTP-binding protein
VALSKADALTPEERKRQVKALKKAAGREPLILSPVSGEGVDQALQMLAREIAAAATSDPNAVPADEEEGWRP